MLGGIMGTVLRYLFTGWSYQLYGVKFPYGTFIVNLVGCFIIGVFSGLPQSKIQISEEMRLLVIVGFCGAFTTFSTWIFETDKLVEKGELTKALLNIVISVVLGYLIYRLGSLIAKMI